MAGINQSERLTAGNENTSFEASSGGNSALDRVKETVAEKLHAAAGAIHQRAEQNQENAASAYAGQAAAWLDSASDYVRDVDQQKIKADLRNQVRRNPGRSLLVAGAAGLVLGILLRR